MVAVGDTGGVPDKNVLRRAFDDLQDGRGPAVAPSVHNDDAAAGQGGGEHVRGVVAGAPAAVRELGGAPPGDCGEIGGRGPRAFGVVRFIHGDEVPGNRP